ncbi:response regulator receiver protein [Amycolatopsis sp. PS_44_ISF1]|uniref:response regulator receiver protein n=1 Tax=Amycolatopsis sp. PS_44_ISF1 TaxID=2974917 RepID=UPI0028DD4C34|nr:response regulator receiver protein [Amycolatopsis sp. PS_44_ISF1]MDT8912777.1 response regulator receiver protein [Amycolatopsis sp. PS_44_ISF1]
MPEQAALDERPTAATALCGFRECRAPLPPPGPRGGRPFEFCPDRRWPGDRTCKQLAAADQALRDALGDAVSHAGLKEAAAEFTRAAVGLGEPLQTLRNALDSVAARAQDEVAAALTRAETAEQRALEADGLRQAADTRSAEAEQAVNAAEDHAHRQQELAMAADARAAEAITTRKAAELAQARAEAVAATAVERADRGAEEFRAERARADRLTAELAERSEQFAVRTAERDAALTVLDQARTRAEETRDSLTAQLTQSTAALAEARTRAGELEAGREAREREHHIASAAAAETVAEQRRRVAVLADRLTESHSRHTHELDALRDKLSRVHRLALAEPAEDRDLRGALLAELLTHRSEGGSDSPPR